MRGCEDPQRCVAVSIRRDAWLRGSAEMRGCEDPPICVAAGNTRPARTRQLHGRARAPSAPADTQTSPNTTTPRQSVRTLCTCGPKTGAAWRHQILAPKGVRAQWADTLWCQNLVPEDGSLFGGHVYRHETYNTDCVNPRKYEDEMPHACQKL